MQIAGGLDAREYAGLGFMHRSPLLAPLAASALWRDAPGEASFAHVRFA
jgi:hypothetical protein